MDENKDPESQKSISLDVLLEAQEEQEKQSKEALKLLGMNDESLYHLRSDVVVQLLDSAYNAVKGGYKGTIQQAFYEIKARDEKRLQEGPLNLDGGDKLLVNLRQYVTECKEGKG